MTIYSHLSYDERVSIEDGLNNNESISKIANDLNRCHSTILREIKFILNLINPYFTTNKHFNIK